MLFKTLDTIRTKPKVIRDQYAFAAALVFTLLVGGIWALSVPSRLEKITEGRAASTTAPFAGLFAQFKNQFSKSDTEATTTPSEGALSAASTTEAALTLDISSTTKASLGTSGTVIHFASTSIQSGTGRSVQIATTSSASTTD